ncbi:zinc-binding oxidoreductase CipB [Mytilinidion resinicola]|uniref:Zinc-binding oxidoreductase CipB n=1 Tax=Mytilinidion resinicola TaxID=574789 RepID=A0A6A6YW68_9PEZI|nr:zinc-binding oxidoreductase CipB [Mytilinidion resinicola]KAF2812633.1 zinc-binding oxidoreductase CipB [Mytilinidion resinicola]
MSNQAAWIPSKGARFEVKESPLTKPAPGEILIKNHVIALNPADHKMQDHGRMVPTFPFILGFEIAGEVVDVGEGVTRFKKGDRVVGLAIAPRTQNLAHAGYQLFTIVSEVAAAHIPEGIPYANAVVLPIGLATAAAGLYEPNYLAQPAPGKSTSNASSGKKSILIWGGSSVVGISAIQLAAASGWTIVSTASPKNHELVRSLGATHVFDYSDPDVVANILKAVEGTTLIGVFDAISDPDTSVKSAEVVHASGGGKLIATTSGGYERSTVLLGDVARTLVYAPTPTPGQELPVWMGVWLEFFEEGLKDGRLKAKPEPTIIEGGLEKIQEALDLLKKGVSATKVVVQL